MKTHLMTVILVLLFFMTSCSSSKTTPEIISEMTRKVESRDFTISVNYAYPLRMRPVYLTPGYDLQLKKDSAFAYLPYFGVAHTASYGTTDGGIKFAEPMTDYSINPLKKDMGWSIRFKVKAKESVYNVLVTIFVNGISTISVSSFDRDDITFNGEMK